MGRRKTPPPGTWAAAVVDEIMREAGRQRLNRNSLAALTALGRTRAYSVLDQERAMTLDEMEAFCAALSLDPRALMDRVRKDARTVAISRAVRKPRDRE